MDSKQTVESSTPEEENVDIRSSAPASDQPTSPPEHQPEIEENAPSKERLVPSALRELIRTEIERRFQSAKDRRWSQLERQYGQLNEPRTEQGELDPHTGETNLDQPAEDRVLDQAEALLTRLGLQHTPQAASLLDQRKALEGPGGYLDAIDQVLEIILKRAVEAGPEAPSPAAIVAPRGAAPSEPDLSLLYEQRKKEIRPGDVNSLTKLKREFRKKGLNIF